MTDETYSSLTQLGGSAEVPASPEEAVLETVPNLDPDSLYLVRFTCPEFTSMCPVTGQPDFAHLVVDYAPNETLVESKSLKLYLASFRNYGAFHEACTILIAKRLEEIARMLAGANVTQTSLDHAGEMLRRTSENNADKAGKKAV